MKQNWYITVSMQGLFARFLEFSFTNSNIVLYYKYIFNIMTDIKIKSKTQKLTLKLVPYLFIAVTIFTAFGSNSGLWVWMITKRLMAWINIGLSVF